LLEGHLCVGVQAVMSTAEYRERKRAEKANRQAVEAGRTVPDGTPGNYDLVTGATFSTDTGEVLGRYQRTHQPVTGIPWHLAPRVEAPADCMTSSNMGVGRQEVMATEYRGREPRLRRDGIVVAGNGLPYLVQPERVPA
jgi:hypothetical protein